MQAAAGAPWIGTMDDPAAELAARGWIAAVTQPGSPEANHGRWTLPVVPAEMTEMPHSWYVTATRDGLNPHGWIPAGRLRRCVREPGRGLEARPAYGAGGTSGAIAAGDEPGGGAGSRARAKSRTGPHRSPSAGASVQVTLDAKAASPSLLYQTRPRAS